MIKTAQIEHWHLTTTYICIHGNFKFNSQFQVHAYAHIGPRREGVMAWTWMSIVIATPPPPWWWIYLLLCALPIKVPDKLAPSSSISVTLFMHIYESEYQIIAEFIWSVFWCYWCNTQINTLQFCCWWLMHNIYHLFQGEISCHTIWTNEINKLPWKTKYKMQCKTQLKM